jgi:predicted hotdog family 3-hydroxylacyl-ACP dehydratase
MLTRQEILALIPHQGTMCLLDDVTAWSVADITCGASSHLSPDNPLRRSGRLGAISGIEYGLQAAALHGALVQGALVQGALVQGAVVHGALARSAAGDRVTVGGAASDTPTMAGPGLLAALRDVTLHVDRLDDRRFGVLRVSAKAELRASSGVIYRFVVASESGMPLVEGRGTIAFTVASP